MAAMFRAAPHRVRVPATAANLGPAFDAAGLALNLYDDIVVQVTETGLDVQVAGEGAETVATGERHLVVKAMRAAFKLLGGQPRGLALRCANRIPHGRGLGSSAAAIVSGVVAAREGVFVEPASAASVAGLVQAHEQGLVDPGQTIVCTVTGHGLKDPQWAIDGAPAPRTVPVDAYEAAVLLGLEV